MRIRWDKWGELIENKIIKPMYEANPENCYLDTDVKFLGKHIVIYPNVRVVGKIGLWDEVTLEDNTILEGEGFVGSGTKIGPFCKIINPKIGRNCKIEGLIIDSEIGEDCEIGRFAKIKNSLISWGVKAKHFCDIDGASVGYLTNVSVDTSVLNFDGKQKMRTIIGNKVFLAGKILGGINIGDEARIYPNSLVDDDVPSTAWFVNPNPGAMPEKPHYYRKIYPHQAWYLAGNYLLLKYPMPSGNRSEFLQKVWMKYRLQPIDEKFKEWLKKPIPHLVDHTVIEALEKDWKENMDCIFGDCEHSKPEREKSAQV